MTTHPIRSIITTLLLALLSFSTTYKIGFYNVENIFDLNHDGGEYNGYVPNSSNRWGLKAFQQKINNIAKIIKEMECDIIAFAEIENDNALQSLQRALRRSGVNYPYSKIFPATRGTGVAALSKYPIILSKAIDIPNQHRPMGATTVDLGSDTLSLIIVHWPSQRNPPQSRQAAAMALSQHLATLPEGHHYIIVGDFNENYDQMARDPLNISGKHLLNSSRIDGGRLKLYEASDILIADGGRHFSPWLEVADSIRFSYRFRGDRGTIDGVLFPASMLGGGRLFYKENSFETFTYGGVLLTDHEPYRWQMQFGSTGGIHLKRGYSDHLPITFTVTTTTQNYREREICQPFSQHREGWVVRQRGVEGFIRDIPAPFGDKALFIGGSSPSTALIAEKELTSNRATLYIMGEGEIRVRVGSSDCGWSDLPLTGGRGGYEEISFEEWRSLPFQIDNCSTSSIQIRSRENIDLNLYIHLHY